MSLVFSVQGEELQYTILSPRTFVMRKIELLALKGNQEFPSIYYPTRRTVLARSEINRCMEPGKSFYLADAKDLITRRYPAQTVP